VNFERVEPIVKALLYEGFMLYPYRPSSVKNRKRFAFGTLQPGESMQTQGLARGDASTRLTVRVRFLDEDDREQTLEHAGVALGEAKAGGVASIESEHVREPDAWKITIRIVNTTEREMRSTHTLIGLEAGELVSLLEPPDALVELAASCKNVGTWPVLVGDSATMLSSPIILYDHPRVAPESPGDLFDATEIDEILTLRVMTLSEDEKAEMARGDARVRAILARTEALGDRAMMRLHGAVRAPFKPGDRVRLAPIARADAFDVVLRGMEATVESVEQDFDGRVALGVTIDCDPGNDLGKDGMVGHRFFFGPEEVERL
jgi:hypothetical protein